MDWTKDRVGGGDKAPQLSDLAETLGLKDGKPHTVRAVGPARRIARHWFETKPKEAGGKNGRFPKICLAYDSETGEFDGKCPYCDIDPNAAKIEVHQNFIDRGLQEAKPRKPKPPSGSEKKKVKHFGKLMYLKSSKSSESWTPVRLAALSTSPARKIQDYTELNKRKTPDGPQVFGPEHPKYGFDMIIKFSKERSPAEMYNVMKDEKTALTEEEMEYLRWPLDLEKPDSLKEAIAEAKRIAPRLAGAEDDEDDEDEDDKPKKKKKKSKSIDVEDEDFDDDDTPKSKKKKKNSRDDDEDDEDDDEPKSKKKKRRPDPDDDEEDDDDDDDEPKTKKKKKRVVDEDDEDDDTPKSKKKKKSRDDDEDDEDEDDEPRSKKKKSVKKSRDDDDDEDEDDEDEPKSKKKKKPVNKKKRSRDDDDDDEDDDEPKSKKKKRVDDDDDDDDWDDDGDDEDDD